MAAIMDVILTEMSKMWKVPDRYTDEGRTMVNRQRHELTTEDLQDGCCGCHREYHNKMVKQFWITMSLQCLPLWRPSWMLEWNEFSSSVSPCLPNASHQVSAQSNIRLDSRCHYGHHGGYRHRTNLAFLNLQVTQMPPIKFRLNPTSHSGAKVVWRFSRWPPWWPSWISEQNDFRHSKSLCCSDASHHVSA